MKRWSIWIAAVLVAGLLGSPRGSGTMDLSASEPPSRLVTPEGTSPKSAETKSSETTPASASITDREKTVRAVIERQLPHASAEEREIWFEQLKDLPPGVVDDLLDVRKQFREVVPPLVPRVLTGFKPTEGVPQASLLKDDAAWLASRDVLQKVRELTLCNLANAETPGYRRLEAVLWPHGGKGVRWGGTRRDLRPGPIRSTQRLLDVAIDGEGWFVAEDGEAVVVTRRGQFAVEDGCLKLVTDRGPLPVMPRVDVPAGIVRTEITSLGMVVGWKTATDSVELAQLEVAILSDAGLAAFDASQPLSRDMIQRTSPGQGAGILVRASLEQSNVAVEEERARLRWIDEWLQRIAAAPE